MSTSKHSSHSNTSAAVKGKEQQHGSGGNFQSLVAGWEYNSCIGKGVTATAVATFPSKSSLVNLGPVPRAAIQPTTIILNDKHHEYQPKQHQGTPPSGKWSESGTSVEEVVVEEMPPARPSTIFSPTGSSHYHSNSNLQATYPSTAYASPSTPSRNAALREQFLLAGVGNRNGNAASLGSSTSLVNTPSSPTTPSRAHYHFVETQPQQHSMAPTTPTYGVSGYRYAGMERLAGRSKIYESPALTVSASPSSTTNMTSALSRAPNSNKLDSAVQSASADKEVVS